MTHRDIILFSTADWDNPLWTNKQHVAIELARRGLRVLYVESIGLRRPTLKSRDMSRMLRRVVRAIRPPQQVRPNLWVWSPLVVPAHGKRWARRLNRLLLRVGLKMAARRIGINPSLLWTYNPLTTELMETSHFSTVVYHCVDEIKAVPGMPKRILEVAERELIARATVIFATSPHLAESRRRLNPRTYYFGNVADYAHFSQARARNTRVPYDLCKIPEPRIGFIGAISSYKLDFALVINLCRSHPEWSIVLIGQVGEGDPSTNVSMLEEIPNLFLLGPRPYSQLPGYLKGFRVAILPSALNEYTAAMFPMKFFEYLAAGLPVVSVDLPALREHADVAHLAGSHDEFISAIECELVGEDTQLEQRVARAQQYTYASRTDGMLAIVEHISSGVIQSEPSTIAT